MVGDPGDAQSASGDAAACSVDRAVMDAVDQGVFAVDDELRIVAANDALAATTGIDREALSGRRASSLVAGDATSVERTLRAVVASDADGGTVDATVETADGGGRPVELRLRGVDADDGQGSRRAVGVVADAAGDDGDVARVDVNELVANLPGMAFRCRNERGWPMLAVSEGAAPLTGYDPADIESGAVSWGEDVIHPDDREDVFETVQSGVADDGEYEVTYRVRTRGGDTKWVREQGQVAAGSGGDRLLGFISDVTQYRETRARLRRERDVIDQVLSSSPVAIAVMDDDGTPERANQRMQDLLGVDDAPAPEFSLDEVTVYDADGDRLDPAAFPSARVLASGEPVGNWLGQLERTDGDRRWVSVNAVPLRDADGGVDRVVVTAEDVTELKETQRRLARRRDELESELAELFGRVTDGFFSLDDDWRFTYVNDRAAALLDRPGAELLGERVWSEFDEAADSTFRRECERAMETQEAVEFEASFPPLDTWFEVHAYPSETGLSVYFHDVTGRKRREQALAALHGVTQNLPHAETTDEVADHVVDAASDVLGLPGVAMYLHDDDAGDLYPAAYSEDMAVLYGDLPRVAATADSSVTGRAFVAGETTRYRDVTKSAVAANDAASVRRTLLIPVGDHGVLLAGDEQVSGFDDDIVELAELLVANAESALDRVARERTLRERERELERYEAIVETIDDGIFALDDEFRLTRVNQGFAATLGYDRDEVLGEHVSTLFDEETAEEVREVQSAFVAGERGDDSAEVEMETADGDAIDVDVRWSVIRDGDEFERVVGVVRDITERKQRERALERYETVVETVDDGVYVLDDEFNFTMVNDAYVEMTGYDRDELLGSHASLVVGDDVTAESARLMSEIGEGEERSATLEADIVRADGTRLPAESNFTVLPAPDSEASWKVGIVRDVSDRVARERELRSRMRQQEATAELGRLALEEPDLDRLFAEATALVADTLDVDYCALLDLDAGAGELRLRQGVGWDDDYVDEATVAADADTQAGYTLRVDGAVVVEDLDAEDRFGATGFLADHDVRSGIHVEIGSVDEPWGVLGAHATGTREFSDHDASFLESVANVLATAVERRNRVREIEGHRQHLAALDNLNAVVQDINAALVESSTRDEIERVVCERLVDADEYAFAWIGRVDRNNGEVTPTEWAGDAESYLENLTITLDDSATGQGPTARAVETMTTQATSSFDADAMEPWRDAAREHGFESSAAIPLVYEGALYGVVNVYAERPGAFDGREGEVVAQLSDVVGHAIRAVERKEALMSESVVELEFRSQSVAEPLLDATRDGGTLRFERTIPTEGDDFLQYVTVEGVSESTFRDAVDAATQISSPRLVTDRGDGLLFEVSVAEPPITSTIASRGGRVRETVVSDGELRSVAELSHSVDIRTLVSALEDEVPDLELVSQRSTQREDRAPLRESALESLTDKQLAAVETAFFAGYFDWPRDSTAEELAESMDVSAPTLHQHLRKGERKLLAGYFEE